MKTTCCALLLPLFLACFEVSGAAPTAPTATTSSAPVFTAEARDFFLDCALADARRIAKVPPEFWTWLEKNSDLKTGLLVANHPMPAVYAENLNLMREHVGPAMADKYAQLLLAVSMRATPLSTESQEKLDPAPENAVQLARWMKSSGTTYQQVMADRKGSLVKAGMPAALEKDKPLWERLPYESGTYPPRLSFSIPDFVKLIIERQETASPAGAKQVWPAFPLASAPYPLLIWFQQPISRRECDWAWERYWGRIPNQPAGIIGYGHYTWDYEKPERKYKVSDWHPSTLPRIWEDGGVCGRLSTMSDCFRRAMGVPAHGAGQPGHRAFIQYSFDAKSGQYHSSVGQSIAGLDVTSADPGLPTINKFLNGRAVSCYAIAAAMNLGLDRYHNSLIAARLAKAEPDRARKKELFEAAAQLNPYHLGVWKELADLAGDASDANAMLARLDSYLFSPDGALALTDPGLSPDTDFSKISDAGMPKQLNKIPNYGTDVARIVANLLAPEIYDRILKSGNNLESARLALRAEIARRDEKKVPYGTALTSEMLTRFDLAVDGPDKVKKAVEPSVALADKVQGKGRADVVGRTLSRVKLVARELPPTEAAGWVASLQAQLENNSPRFSIDAKGKPQAELFYSELQKIRMDSMKRQGKSGAAQAKKLQDAFNARLAGFLQDEIVRARAEKATLAAELARADQSPAKVRTKALNDAAAKFRTASLVLPPAEVDAWLTRVLADLKARGPRFEMNKGKPRAESSYGTLHNLLVAALKRGDAAEKTRAEKLAAEFDAALKSFAAAKSS